MLQERVVIKEKDMKLTGHPLVDTGLAIAALHCKKQSISDLSEADLKQAVHYLNSVIDPTKSNPGPLNNLKVLSAYWQNNPLAGHNMGTNGQNVPDYRRILENAAQDSQKQRRGCCQICGRPEIFIDANRSWLPLGASSDGDPCSLPNLSGKFICVFCFSATILLPLGCRFVGNNPYLYHMTDPEILCEAAKDSFADIKKQLNAKASGNNELKAKVDLSGRAALLEIVSGSLLWDVNQGGMLTQRLSTGATIIAFSNAGTSASWYQLHLPAQALDFFAELDSAPQTSTGTLRRMFLTWAKICEKADYTDKTTKEKRTNPYFDLLCENIEQRRSLAFLVRAIVRNRSFAQQNLTKEERQVLEIYERVALNKQERFEMLGRIADRINDMDERYRNSFLKRLANMRSKDNLLKMLTEYAHSEKTSLHISRDEIRMIDAENAGEVISLLYLLCVAEK